MANKSINTLNGTFTFSVYREDMTYPEFMQNRGTELKTFFGSQWFIPKTPSDYEEGFFPYMPKSKQYQDACILALIPRAGVYGGIFTRVTKPHPNKPVLAYASMSTYNKFFSTSIGIIVTEADGTVRYSPEKYGLYYALEYDETGDYKNIWYVVIDTEAQRIVTKGGLVYGDNIQYIKIILALFQLPPNQPDTPTSPGFPGDTSTGGGGNGNFDNTSDSVGIPSVPSFSVSDGNMVTFWTPTLSQLQQVADYLTSKVSDIIDFSKWGVTPFDNIISLSMLPFAAPQGAVKEWRVPTALIATGITMPLLQGQWYKVDCGHLTLTEYWGSALDYAPYTRISIFLPFIGVQSLIVDEVMGGTINPVYTINMCTGEAVCNVAVTKNGVTNVLYSYPCNISSSIPVTAADASRLRSALIKTIVTGAAGVAVPAAGVAAPAIAGSGIATAISSKVAPHIPSAVSKAGGVVGNAAGSAIKTAASGNLTASARDVISSKADVIRTGSLSGGSGFMGGMIPYLIITRPKQSLPENYNVYRGYPCNMTLKLGYLSGFTTVTSVHIDNIAAYPEEIQAIESALAGGVIF